MQDLCERLGSLDAGAQEALLATEPDASLREEVRRMLQALVEEPQASRRPAAPVPRLIPAFVGPYRIEAMLGRGGTGTVYAAEIERGGVRQPVAVKVLDAFLDDTEAAGRFQREHEMLARLDHPAITRVFDAGVTAEQRPYLVMERVAGQTLDAYCREQRLPIAGRLRLMMAICDAVQAAHRSLIVHLDLKPSNILVTAAGQVKLLDFGTAKLIDPAGALTTTRQLTPMYASPEQLRGEPVTTACDVYSLGLILYELLSGSWPFASRSSLVAVSERAAGATGTRPLAEGVTADGAGEFGLTADRLRHALQGDLDLIVRKAMAAEPHGRYETPAALAADLQAHLESRPVRAQRQTTLYRARKYAARNSGAVALTFVLVLGMLAAASVAWWQQQQKVAAGRRAQATAQFLGQLFQGSNPMYGGRSGQTVLDLVERADQQLSRGNVLDPALAASLQTAFGSLALTDGRPEQGSRMIAQGLDRARRSGDPSALLGALTVRGREELSAGRCPTALNFFREGDEVVRAHHGQLPPTDRASFWISRGQVKQNCEKDQPGVLELCQRAEREIPNIPDDPAESWTPPRIFKALVLNGVGRLYLSQRRYADARRALNAGLAVVAPQADANAARVALHTTFSQLEYGEGSVARSAAALGQAVAAMEGGYVSTFEYLRTKTMWASRRAEAGEAAPAVQLVDDVLAQTRARAAEIGPTRWMILVDAAFAYQRAGHCDPVPGLVREADLASAGAMPPQWKGNRLAAEALCLAKTNPAAARPVAAAALQELQPFLLPTSGLRQRLEAAAR